MLLLTDEEIQKASGLDAIDYYGSETDFEDICPKIAQAQLKKVIKQMKKVEKIEYDQDVLWHCIRDSDWKILFKEET